MGQLRLGEDARRGETRENSEGGKRKRRVAIVFLLLALVFASVASAASGLFSSEGAWPALDFGAGQEGGTSQAAADAALTSNGYRDEVLADGPRAYWRLGESTGTVAADQLASNPGTYGGGAALARPGALVTDTDTAVLLDGVNDYVVVPDANALDVVGAVSVEAWVKRSKSSVWQAVVGKPGHGQSKLENYSLWVGPGNKPTAFFGDGTKSARIEAPTALDTNWHHVVATYDNATARIYVDGVLRASSTSNVVMAPNTLPLNFGRVNTGGNFYGGSLDEVALYGTALSAARVQAHYEAGAVTDTTPPAVTLATPAQGAKTSDTTPVFSGTAGTTAGDSTSVSVKVYSGVTPTGTPVQTLTTTRDVAGAYSVEAATALADGAYTARSEQSDANANLGQSSPITFTVDTVAPDTSITSGPTDPSASAEATFEFSATEAGSSFACALDGGPFAACVSPKAYSGLADGSHTFQVRAADGAGNVDSSPAARTWSVDTVAPAAPSIDAGPVGSVASATATFDFSGAEVGSTYQCRLDAGSFAACTSPKSYSSLAEGAHTFQVRAVDAAGGASAAASRTWTVDTVAPDTSIVSGPADPSASADASFALSATEAGASFECSLDAAAFAACVSPQTYSGLAEGAHTFRVQARDLAGNLDSTPAARTWTVDTVSPPVPSIDSGPADPSASADASFTFSDSEPGVLFRCRIDGGAFAQCLSPKAYSSLVEGDHTFEVLAVDAAGNTSGAASRAWTIDAPPVVSLTAPADGSVVADPTPTFSGTAGTAPGDSSVVTVRVYAGTSAGGSPLQTLSTTRNGQGAYSVAAGSVLADGPYTARAEQSDTAGNLGQSAPTTFTVDATPPAAPTIDAGPPDSSTSAAATFEFSHTETGLSFRCRLDGGAFAACTSPKDYSGLADGAHTFQVVAVDAAGNVSPAASRSWTIDALAPDTSIGSAPANPSSSSAASFTFSSEPGTAFDCELDGGGFAACTSPKSYSGLSEGSHTFRVRARDAAGNVDPTPAARTWTVDTVAPGTTIDSAPPALSTSTAATFQFSSPDGGASFECALDGAPFTACVSPKQYSGLGQGLHDFEVRARDAAGNVDATPAAHGWTVDTGAPPAPSIDSGPSGPTPSTGASFSFSHTEPGVSFRCRLDGAAAAACSSPKAYAGLEQGPHTFGVVATDAAGNASGEANRSWIVDTVAPDTTIFSAPPLLSASSTGTFSFSSGDSAASFECSLNGGPFTACSRPKQYASLAEGSHTFEVRARDAAGNIDSTPASHAWTVDTVAPPVPSIDAAPPNPSTSANATFAFSDTEGGVTFRCRLDGAPFAACTSPKSYSTLTEAPHTFEVVAVDSAGNASGSASRTWTVDTPPVVTLTAPADGRVIDDATPTFTGTAGAGPADSSTVTVNVYRGTTPTGTPVQTLAAARAADGAWSVEPSLPLIADTYTARAQQSDGGGNVGISNATTFTIASGDVTPPAIVLSAPANGTDTNDPTPTVAGSAGTALGDLPEVNVNLYRGADATGAPLQTHSTLADGDGSFSVDALPALLDGVYTAQAEQADASGNIGATAEHSFTVDTVPPESTIDSGPSGPVDTSNATFTFSSEAGATFECQLDNGPYASCSSPRSYSGLAEGAHTFRVRARDLAGNVDPTPAQRSWTVDTVAPPTPTIQASPSNPSSSSSAVFQFSSSETTATLRCRLDSAPFSECTSPTSYAGLTEGNHSFDLVAVDAAGNASGAALHSWTVDTLTPTVTLTMPPNGGTTADATPLFAGVAGTAAGDSTTVTIRVYAATTPTGTPVRTLTAVRGSGGWYSVEPTVALGKGTFTARAEQADTAGHTGLSAPTTFVVSSSAYRREVLADSPRVYYRLGETTGTAAADETGTNPGTYANGVALGQSGALSTNANSAASFDGVNDYVVAPHSTSLSATTAVTVETWVKRAKSGVWQVLVSKPGNGQSKLENYSIWINSLDRPVAFFGDGVAFARVDGPVLDTNWHHVAATYDNATARIYVDGVLRASTSSTVRMLANTLPLNIGRTNGNINFFGGLLDEVAVYGTALSAARIQAHYTAATAFDAAPPVVTLSVPANGDRGGNTTPTFSGTAGVAGGDLPAVSVKVYSGSTVSGAPVQTLTATADPGGAYSVPASSALPEGTYTAQAEQSDDVGNVGFSSANTFIVTFGDVTAPVVTLTSPANGSTTIDRTPAFSGVAGTAAGDSQAVTVKIYLGNSATGTPTQTLTTPSNPSTGAYVVDAATMSAATYTARAQQTDGAGNVGQSAPTTFTIPSEYRAAVMAHNPRAYWRLGEAAGPTATDQTGVNPATYTNVTLGGASPLTGDRDTAASFDGLSSFAIAPDSSSLDATTGVTVEAWVKRSKGAVWQCVVGKPCDGSSKNENYSIWISPFDRPVAFFGNGTAFVRVEASASLDTNWHHVVATYDNGTAKVYTDGVLQASVASTVRLTANNLPLNMGKINTGGSFYGGLVDEVAVYGTALSVAQIGAHFDAANLYDTTAPVVSLSTPDQGTRTKDPTPVFAGMAEITSRDSSVITIRVYSGASATGTPIRTLSANRFPTGAWDVSPTSALADGTYTAQAEQSDASANVGLSAPKTFTVLQSLPPSPDPVMVGAGDIGDCETESDDNVGQLLNSFPTAVVYTVGDNAYPNGTLEQFNNCLHPAWGHAKERIRPAIGGHDLQTPQAGGYMTYFADQLAPFGATASDPTKGYYSYNLGGWHVLVLNTECVKDTACSVPNQIAWMRADLDANPVPCTLAIVPNPRFSSGSVHPSNASIQPFWDVLYEKNVEIALGADEHVYERFAPQNAQGVYDPVRGVREFIAGTGGSSHYSFGVIRANSELRNNATFGLLKFTLHAGSYEWEFVPEAGFTFMDSGSAACH